MAVDMKTTVVLASLLVTTLAAAHLAHADGEATPTRYLQTDVMIGGSAPVAGPNLLGAVSAGYLATPNVWLRGELAGGPAADDQGGGSNVQARAGVETRA